MLNSDPNLYNISWKNQITKPWKSLLNKLNHWKTSYETFSCSALSPCLLRTLVFSFTSCRSLIHTEYQMNKSLVHVFRCGNLLLEGCQSWFFSRFCWLCYGNVCCRRIWWIFCIGVSLRSRDGLFVYVVIKQIPYL